MSKKLDEERSDVDSSSDGNEAILTIILCLANARSPSSLDLLNINLNNPIHLTTRHTELYENLG